MTVDNWLVVAILLVALFLFIIEKPRVDVVALLVLVACVLTGLVTPDEAFLGFASPAVVTVWAVFIISGALTKTGVADQLGQLMIRIAGDNPTRLMIVMMITAGVMSAFMNNIGAVAILLPAVVSISRQINISPSKMLIPLAVAGLLGGNITLIGTPPNLIASASLQQYGLEPFRFFDFAPTGVVVLAVGIIYMLVLGRYLLPDNASSGEITDGYALRDNLKEAVVTADSPLIWRKINTLRFGPEQYMAIVYVRRGEEFLQQASDRRLRVDDVLLLEGAPDDIHAQAERFKFALKPDLQETDLDREVEGGGRLVEVSLSPRSVFRGKTLRELSFRSRFGVTVLAMRHEGDEIVSNVIDVPLRFGDVLLVQGSVDKISRLQTNPNLIILDEEQPEKSRNRGRAPHTIAILVATLVAISMQWIDTSTAMLLGGLCMVMVGALSMEEAYQSIDWKSVFLIAGMLPLGMAMEKTGTAALLAENLITLVGGWGTTGILVGLFVLATGLTSVISNAAATVLIVPIAIDAAQRLGVNPQPLVMTAVIAASTAFLLPIGHQANIIIFGPGNYKFSDFFKVGIWLTLLLMIVTVTIVPIFWPL